MVCREQRKIRMRGMFLKNSSLFETGERHEGKSRKEDVAGSPDADGHVRTGNGDDGTGPAGKHEDH